MPERELLFAYNKGFVCLFVAERFNFIKMDNDALFHTEKLCAGEEYTFNFRP